MEYDVRDLVSDVIYYLSTEDTYNVSSICKKYNRLIYYITQISYNNMKDISSFFHLKVLNLSYNHYIKKINHLTNLTELNLSNNHQISKISKLTELLCLNLDQNNTVCHIGTLTNLRSLSLYRNKGISHIDNITNLTSLDLFRNKLIGSISSLINLTNLSIVNSCIHDISHLTNLKTLELAHESDVIKLPPQKIEITYALETVGPSPI